MAADVLLFPGVALPDAAPFEPCSDLIHQLEHALEIARGGQMLGFVMVFEKPGQRTGSLTHICTFADRKQLLAALAIEQHDLAADISANDQSLVETPPEGA